MKFITTVSGIKEQINGINLRPLGLVPTMGALHEGHLELVRNAINKCRIAAISIYVNPAQFNDKEDLKHYPRTIESDLELLKDILRENDIVFFPSDKEIYPEPDTRVFDFGNLDKVMEGKKRPGHFNGVAQVVNRLFRIVEPDYAFFGQKDFQQLTIVKDLVRQTGENIKIIVNPIVRESDGLAMSSRNRLLEPQLRKNAGIIYRSLVTAKEMLSKNDIPEVRSQVIKTIDDVKGFNVEYFEIVDDHALIPVNKKREISRNKRYFGCIAVKAGKIRLIDNIEFNLA